MNRLNNVKLCRTCLSAIFNGFNIHETIYQLKTSSAQLQAEVRVSEIFEQFTGIILNENDVNLPKYLCLVCLERLFNAYEFFEICKTSDVALKTFDRTQQNVEVDKLEKQAPSKDGSIDYRVNNDDDVDNERQDDDQSSCSNEDDYGDPDFVAPSQINGTSTMDEDETTSNLADQIKKVFECLKCNEAFSGSIELKRHERIHEGNWSCTECDKVLTTKYTFRHHMMLHMGKPFACKVCTRRFSRNAELTRHIKIYHLTGKSYKCDECPKEFYTNSHLRSHKVSHAKKKRKKDELEYSSHDMEVTNKNENGVTQEKMFTISPVQTETCTKNRPREIRNFPFNRRGEIESSEPAVVVKQERSFQTNVTTKYYRCKKCFKKFRHRKNYLRHLEIIRNCQADLNCRTNPQKCQYCPVISDNVTSLRKHLELHLDQNPFRCKICNKNYNAWRTLAEHTRQMHLMKKKYHLCTVCGRSLPSAKLLEEHYLIHQGVRNYNCEYCGRAFYTNTGLKQHTVIHTRDSLQCSECGKILADKVTLRNHLTLHFGKKFKCSICEKLFPNVGTLNRHMKVHRGDRDFQCDRCSKCYMRRGHLKDHIRKVHENPNKNICEECGKEFNHRGSLNKHRRLEHGEKPVFRCNECGKCFGRKYRLKEHRNKYHYENLDTSNQIEEDQTNLRNEENLNGFAENG